MSTDDFERLYQQMGLTALPVDVSVEATFASGEHDSTMASGPRAELTQVEAAHAGTLPRLTLTTPDAVRDGDEDGELLVVDVLGEGGMGQVLLARQHSLGREVAVKVLKPGAVHPAAAEGLIAEARTTGSLEHPGVVPVYALARDSRGLPALVMKRVDGVSWRELLHDDQHPAWERIASGRDRLQANLEVLIQVCNAVAHAHRRGVIHRDLKPANILIGELGEVYVADWGVAIQKAHIRQGPPQLVGTPAYLAPEMVTGDASLTDERTDVYLLGGTLHEVLARRPPHLGGSLHDVLQRAFAAAPPALPPDVPRELAALCTRALAADPRSRFASAVELRDAIRVFLQHRDSIQLSNTAAMRLRKMEQLARTPLDAASERVWYALVSECRFGFSHALEADPQSPEARAGLERCLEIAAQRDLDRKATGAARAFLSEMAAPAAALGEALRALELEEAGRAVRDQRFKLEEHENNPLVSAQQRNALIIGLALTIASMVLFFGILTGPREYLEQQLGRWSRIIPMGIISFVYLVLLGAGRKALLATRVNRQMMALVGVGCAAVFLSRLQLVYMDVPLAVAMVHDAWMIGAIMIVCSFLLHWGFAVSGAFFVLGGLGIGFFPQGHPAIFFSGFSAVGLIVSVVMFQHWKKDLEKQALADAASAARD